MFTETDNPLAQFGQRPTPPAGARITKIVIKNEDHTGYFDRIKERYGWMPLHDLNFVGFMTQQPMSVPYLERGRIGWFQSVPYKAIDNSPEALDQNGEQELPLRTFIMTPFGQCVYLHSAFAEKGLRVFEHLKAEPPELVALIESVLLPTVPGDLLSLGRFLTENGLKAIEGSALDTRGRELAKLTLASMLEGVQVAVKYCRELISATESEILTRRNKGVGKASLDDNDRFAYVMLRKIIPAESTLDSGPEHKTNELLEKLVKLIDGRTPASATPPPTEAEETITQLRQELDTMKEMFATAMAEFKTKVADINTGAPEISKDAEDLTPERVEEEAENLRSRLKTGHPPKTDKRR